MRQNYAHKIFEQTASQFPDRIAVQDQMRKLTYRQLDEQAGQLSLYHKGAGAHDQSIIGIYLDADADYLVSMLGILKAGACFMPLGLSYSRGFLSSVLNAVDPAVIITNQHLAGKLSEILVHTTRPDGYHSIVVISDNLKTVHIKTLENPDSDIKPEPDKAVVDGTEDHDGCYIILTSGSTGRPKPIWGSHKGLCHFVLWEIDEFNLNKSTRGSLLSPVTFDVSLRDMFVPLFAGGTVCIPDKNTRLDMHQLYRWLKEQRISLTHMVPTLFRMLTRAIATNRDKDDPFPDLHWILIAGEPLFGIDLLNWRKVTNRNRAGLVNLYGPSETTLAKLFYRIVNEAFAPEEIIPIGKAIPETQVLIIENQRLCSTFETGEIHIKTSYASKGYYKDQELNRQCFIQNPLDECKNDIIYRTGDYGEYLNDGNVKFLGRKDKQIKLNGKRIDMHQIEIHLRSHALVKECAVDPRNDAFGNKRLVAYIVLEDEKQPTVEGLKRYLREKIPEFMIPTFFLFIEEMPLTHSGKINRRALPDPKNERPLLEQAFVIPKNNLQRELSRIWCEVLGIDKVGIHDNFFDIGGTSLLSMAVCKRIQEALKIDIPVVKLFEYPRIHSLAQFISDIQNGRSSGNMLPSIEDRRRYYKHHDRRNIKG